MIHGWIHSEPKVGFALLDFLAKAGKLIKLMHVKLLSSLVFLLISPMTLAGTLYRCVSSDGITHYSSLRVPGADCRVAAQYRPEPQRAVPRPAPTPPASASTSVKPASPSTAVATAVPAKRVEFRSASPGQALAAPKAASGAKVTRGAVYRYERDGIVHYTNVAPRGVAAVQKIFTYIEVCYACSALPNVNFSSVSLNLVAFADEIRAASEEFGVEEAIVRAIIHAESAFRTNALSNKSAQGLMQLIPATARRFGVTDPFDAAQNIRGGTQYLSWLLKRFNGDLTLASAGYNAGEGAVDRFGGVPPYAETQRYVQRVAQLADRYRAALNGKTTAGSP